MRVILMLLAVLLGRAALAAPACPVPRDLPALHAEAPHDREEARTVPIGGYTLAMFWMPQHCRQAIKGIAEIECRRPEVRASGLMLHGLWPDGEGREWPQWCQPVGLVGRGTIAAHYCATPSAQLMQHEFAKHGSCMPGYTPERYFDRAESLYRGVRLPDLRAMSYGRLTVAGVKRAIADRNPGLAPEMMRLNLDRRGWLEEVWVCLDTRFAPRRCAGVDRRQPDDRVLVWRGGRAAPD